MGLLDSATASVPRAPSPSVAATSIASHTGPGVRTCQMVTPSPGQHTRCRPKRSTVRTMVVAVNKPTKSSFGILFRSDFDSPVGARDSPRAGSSAPPGVTLEEFLHSFQNLMGCVRLFYKIGARIIRAETTDF